MNGSLVGKETNNEDDNIKTIIVKKYIKLSSYTIIKKVCF